MQKYLPQDQRVDLSLKQMIKKRKKRGAQIGNAYGKAIQVVKSK